MKGRSRQHEFELKLLEHEQKIDTNDQLSPNDTYPPQTGMSMSKAGRYFAFCKELVLTVFDLNTMKLEGKLCAWAVLSSWMMEL